MILKFINRLRRDRKGQGLVEYALLIGGVALIGAAAVSVFGHKTNDIIAAVASVLPGAHMDDNNPIASGHIIETAASAPGKGISLDLATITANSKGTNDRLLGNVAGKSQAGNDA